jgi:phospholipid/cholesterol/gamma-HCH transport system substrate-binding protein
MKEIKPVYHPEKVDTRVKVGIITVVALIVLVAGYGWLHDWFMSGKYTQLKVQFDNANNVDVGDGVTIYGVKKGRVESISLTREGALLSLLVDLEFPLSSDTQFYLRESSVMGSRQVEIIPGTGETLLDTKAVAVGHSSTGITSLIPKIDNLMSKLDVILTSISAEDGIVSELSVAVKSTKSTLSKVDLLVEDNKQPIKEMVANLGQLADALNGVLSENKEIIDKSIKSTLHSIEEVSVFLVKAQAALDELKPTIEKLNREDGTVQQLISDRELYDKLLETTTRIDSLLIDIKKNPRRYFQLKVF